MKKKGLRRRIAGFLATCIALLTISTGYFGAENNVLLVRAEEINTQTLRNICLDETHLVPVDGTWDSTAGHKIYFGQYNDTPTLFRVLKAEQNKLLLDGDRAVCRMAYDHDLNPNAGQLSGNCHEWKGSDIQAWLNGAEYYLNTDAINPVERAAILQTTLAASEQDYELPSGLFKDYASTDYVFLLSAAEAYNLYKDDSRAKPDLSGNEADCWLRSGYPMAGVAVGYIVMNVGVVTVTGVEHSHRAVCPAFNLDGNQVLFASAVGAEGASLVDKSAAPTEVEAYNSTANTWKLTLLDASKTLNVTSGEDVIKKDNRITIPYTYTGNDVSQISVMITNKAYNESGAEVLYYGALQEVTDTDSDGSPDTTGTGSFELPSELPDEYKIYMLAEDINDAKHTDYASTPVELIKIVNLIESVEVSIEAPAAGKLLALNAQCGTAGVAEKMPDIVWKEGTQVVTGNAGYNKSYMAEIVLTTENNHLFTDATSVSVNGRQVNATKNKDGSLSICDEFTTPKAKLLKITAPDAITGVPNGTAQTAEALGLPAMVPVSVEGNEINSAKVEWNLQTFASGSYSPDVTTEQTFTLNGTVLLPEEIDANGVSLSVQITVTVIAKEEESEPGIIDKPWPFTDIPEWPGYWKYDNVEYVYDRDIMNGIAGTTLFDPDGKLNRAMFATVLYRMAGNPPVEFQEVFTDVEDGRYYSKAVMWVREKGIAEGFQDGSYGVEKNITREQIAKMLCEYAQKQGYDASGKASLDTFTDKNSVNYWAVDYVMWTVDTGMITGKPNDDGTFRIDPKGDATRAECAKMLTMFLKKYAAQTTSFIEN